jgi:hypothetical protein
MTLVPGTVLAQQSTANPVVVGAAVGGTSGAIVGGLMFGPIGAIIGGFAGASIGADASVPEPVIVYVSSNPVEPVYFDEQLDVGFQLSNDVQLYPVPDSDYAYFYANGRAYVVEPGTRVIVYSPGFVVSESAVAYIRANPVQSMPVDVDLVAGYAVAQNVTLWDVPNYPDYSYAYFNDRPALIDADTRLIIWIEA